MYHHYIHEKLAEARSREFERMAREHAAVGRRAREDGGATGRRGLGSRLASMVGRRRPKTAEIRIRYAEPADAARLRSLEERLYEAAAGAARERVAADRHPPRLSLPPPQRAM